MKAAVDFVLETNKNLSAESRLKSLGNAKFETFYGGRFCH